MKPLHIALVGHVAGEHVAEYLRRPVDTVPTGYTGAPLTGILIGELLRLGHRVTAITTDSSLPLNDGPVTLEHGSFRFVVCPARRRAWRNNGFRLGRAVDGFLFERRQIGAAIRDARPDIVHAHWSYEFALAAIAQPFPHLITCHDSPADVLRLTKNLYRTIRYLMAKQAFSSGKNFSTVSNYMANTLMRSLRSSPAVISNPISNQAFTLGFDRDPAIGRTVAVVSNGWGGIKNTSAAIQGFAMWRKSEPDAELWLFGEDHGINQRAHAWAKRHSLTDGVHFIGKVEHAVLLAEISKRDVLLHTALEESFGVVVAEAMALGLPVVGGRHSGAVPELLAVDIEGLSPCGIAVDVTSPISISNGLAKIFSENYQNRSKRGRALAIENYSAPKVAQSYVKSYTRILENHSK